MKTLSYLIIGLFLLSFTACIEIEQEVKTPDVQNIRLTEVTLNDDGQKVREYKYDENGRLKEINFFNAAGKLAIRVDNFTYVMAQMRGYTYGSPGTGHTDVEVLYNESGDIEKKIETRLSGELEQVVETNISYEPGPDEGFRQITVVETQTRPTTQLWSKRIYIVHDTGALSGNIVHMRVYGITPDGNLTEGPAESTYYTYSEYPDPDEEPPSPSPYNFAPTYGWDNVRPSPDLIRKRHVYRADPPSQEGFEYTYSVTSAYFDGVVDDDVPLVTWVAETKINGNPSDRVDHRFKYSATHVQYQ